MKKYTYTVNSPFGFGTHTIEAKNKKEAIEKANKKWLYSGVNVSSFRLAK